MWLRRVRQPLTAVSSNDRARRSRSRWRNSLVSSGTSSASTERPTDDVLDLAEASREAVLKRALPIIGGVVVLLILLRIIRR